MAGMKTIKALEPGQTVLYHIGNLSRDRVDPKVARIADLYRAAARQGRGALTQRRISDPYVSVGGRFVDGAFAYVFTRFGGV